MFTGIIQGLGHIEENHIDESGCKLRIDLQAIGDQEINIGDSVAVNGVCLTVVTIHDALASFDVSLESLSKTCIGDWTKGEGVNLEPALTLQVPLGGHIVTGHVDGVGEMLERTPAGDAIKMVFSVPAPLGRYMAQKGSVCINGVSLTVNQVLEDTLYATTFSVMLVPHTLEVTSLNQLVSGSRVHIEIDVIARYLDRMNEYDSNARNNTNK